MDDLISRKALLGSYKNPEWHDGGERESDPAIIAIREAPAVDAVEVVRCRKCQMHGHCGFEDTFKIARLEDPFCCVGKRKEAHDERG